MTGHDLAIHPLGGDRGGCRAARGVLGRRPRVPLGRCDRRGGGVWRGDWRRIRREAAADRSPAGREAVNTWRQRRRLLSADETVTWLGHWCIDLADLCHLGFRAPGADADVDRVAWIEAVCSGAHRDLAWRLAERVALAPSLPDVRSDLDLAELERLDREFERRRQEIGCSEAVTRLIAAIAGAELNESR
jgi:hypothetical protein